MWSNTIKLYCSVFCMLYTLVYCTDSYGHSDSAKIKPSIVFDSSEVNVRSPLADKQKELLNNPDYKYDRVGPAPKTIWERFKEWFYQKLGQIFDSEGGALGLQILKYILITAAIVTIILLLLKNNVRALFYGKSASVSIDFKEFEEDIHKINFQELISNALYEKDFRRAVRLHFLKVLKELTDKNLITWKIDKTNHDYSIELSNTQYINKFKELSILYEYIWYGSFELDEANFKTTLEKFNTFSI